MALASRSFAHGYEKNWDSLLWADDRYETKGFLLVIQGFMPEEPRDSELSERTIWVDPDIPSVAPKLMVGGRRIRMEAPSREQGRVGHSLISRRREVVNHGRFRTSVTQQRDCNVVSWPAGEPFVKLGFHSRKLGRASGQNQRTNHPSHSEAEAHKAHASERKSGVTAEHAAAARSKPGLLTAAMSQVGAEGPLPEEIGRSACSRSSPSCSSTAHL